MIYFLYGENDFARSAAIDELAAGFVKENSAEAVTKIDAGEVDSAQILGEILNLNLFTPRRFFVIKNASENKKFWEDLPDNLPRVPDEFDVIFVAARPDKRTKTFKELSKKARTQEFPLLNAAAVKSWLFDEARKRGAEIEPAALNELLELTSGEENPQARLSSELDKLGLLKEKITAAKIRQFVEPNLATNAFEILELSLRGEREKCAREIEKLQAAREDANKFLGLLASQIFALAGAIFGDSNAAKELKIHPFQLSKMRDLARNLDDPKKRVKKMARILAETDARMKLSNSDEAWTLVEIALAKM